MVRKGILASMLFVKIAVGLVLFLILYIVFAWFWSRRNNPLLAVNKNTQIVNFGSTYAYYDIDYSSFDVGGVNLANFPQYLDYDFIMCKKVINKLPKSAKIIFTFPNFVFAGTGTDPKRRQYYEVLKPSEMKSFKFRNLFYYIYRASIEPFTHYYFKRENKWKGYVASYEEKYEYALKRIRDWENPDGQVQIPSVKRPLITDKHLERISVNKKIVIEMVKWCSHYDFEPYLLLFPASDVMRTEISEECLEEYLYKPLREIIEDLRELGFDIKVLDYSQNKELSNMNLYMNGDCFNEEGRRKFTEMILRDVGLIK